MKLLVVSDIHGYVDKLKDILIKENDVEMIIFTGDIAPYRKHFETINLLNKLLTIAREFNTYIIAIPGNVDYINHYEQLENPIFIYLHKRYKKVKDIVFIGLGGSTTTPFHTMLEFSEEEIYKDLQSTYISYIQNEKTLDRRSKVVLVTHSPPYNSLCDKIFTGEHVGSKAIRGFIEEVKPLLALCGHVHESRCIDKISTTTVVNPGPLAKGFYGTIYISCEGIDVKLNKI